MKKWLIVGVSAVLCVVVIGAFTYSYTSFGDVFKPSLTGDRASDEVCAAAVSAFVVDGKPIVSKMFGMTPEERRELSEAIESPMRDATITDITDAATGVLAGLTVAGNAGAGAGFAGIFAQAAFAGKLTELNQACRAHGWTPQKAGLLPK
jgi:hypothetical protein